jgi:hypothetical protein
MTEKDKNGVEFQAVYKPRPSRRFRKNPNRTHWGRGFQGMENESDESEKQKNTSAARWAVLRASLRTRKT